MPDTTSRPAPEPRPEGFRRRVSAAQEASWRESVLEAAVEFLGNTLIGPGERHDPDAGLEVDADLPPLVVQARDEAMCAALYLLRDVFEAERAT